MSKRNTSEETKTEAVPVDADPAAEVEPERAVDQPLALVGSGTPMIDIRLNVGCLGLRAGTRTTVIDDFEAQGLIASGKATKIDGNDEDR